MENTYKIPEIIGSPQRKCDGSQLQNKVYDGSTLLKFTLEELVKKLLPTKPLLHLSKLRHDRKSSKKDDPLSPKIEK
jgi:hypothetical protein